MHVALTVRKLKQDGYEDWRSAWQPERYPEQLKGGYILRNVNDPDEVIAFGFFEGDVSALRDDPDFASEQQQRLDAMAPFIESIGADGIYEVVEEFKP